MIYLMVYYQKFVSLKIISPNIYINDIGLYTFTCIYIDPSYISLIKLFEKIPQIQKSTAYIVNWPRNLETHVVFCVVSPSANL